MSLLLLDDDKIGRFGLPLEGLIGDLLSECMSAPPFHLNWPKRITDVSADAPLSASAQGTWRKMRSLSAESGGGSLVWYDDCLNLPVGYAHCVILTDQIISDFRLSDPALSDCALPGELLLTFAGLERHFRGQRVDEQGQLIEAPMEGWETVEASKRPGKTLYNVLYSKRLELWGQGRKVWNRTHPDCEPVIRTANRFGLKQRGQFMVNQGGSETPKVVFSTDGAWYPNEDDSTCTSASSAGSGAE